MIRAKVISAPNIGLVWPPQRIGVNAFFADGGQADVKLKVLALPKTEGHTQHITFQSSSLSCE
jgi:hypothetical protein